MKTRIESFLRITISSRSHFPTFLGLWGKKPENMKKSREKTTTITRKVKPSKLEHQQKVAYHISKHGLTIT